MMRILRGTVVVAAVFMSLGAACFIAIKAMKRPPELPPRYVGRDQAAEGVARDVVQRLKEGRKGRIRLALLDNDGFDRAAMPEWEPEEINSRLYAAIDKAGLQGRVSFTADKETAVKMVGYLKKFDSAIYAGSFADKFGHGQIPDLRMTCRVLRAAGAEDKARLECSLYDLSEQKYLSSAAEDFVPPDHVASVREAGEFYATAQSRLHSAVEAAVAAGAASTGAALLLGALYWRRRGQLSERLPDEMAQIKGLIDQHSFSAADKELRGCLEYLPDDPALNSLRDRLCVVLSDYGGDALAAEKTALRIRHYEQMGAEGLSFTEADADDLKALPGPQAQTLRKRLEGKAAETQRLDFESRAAAAGRAWDEAAVLLARADTAGALKAADAALAIDGEHAGARGLAFRAKKSPARVLRPTKTGKEIRLMRDDVFIIGRDRSKGAGIVVSDDRISRAHLKLCVLRGKLLAEDLGSTGGSFLAGQKIVKSYVSDGDILSLAKVLQVQVCLCGGAELQGVFLDFPAFSVLWGRMPVTFTAAGILPAKSSPLELVYKDGILLLGKDGNYRSFGANEAVSSDGVSYEII